MFDLTPEELVCLKVLLVKLDRNRHFAPAIGVDLSSVLSLRAEVDKLLAHVQEEAKNG